jgi:hypothetical protein
MSTQVGLTQSVEVQLPAWAEPVAEAAADALATQEDTVSLHGYDAGWADAGAGTTASAYSGVYVIETVPGFQGS